MPSREHGERSPPGNSTPTATLTGLGVPHAGLDSGGNLFVANYGGDTVSEFAPGSTTPTATLTGLNEPQALAFDSSGNLYVANSGITTVSKFLPNTTKPKSTLSVGKTPWALAFDSTGNLYVANSGTTTVSRFKAGDYDCYNAHRTKSSRGPGDRRQRGPLRGQCARPR